jgi:hypothetical protein
VVAAFSTAGSEDGGGCVVCSGLGPQAENKNVIKTTLSVCITRRFIIIGSLLLSMTVKLKWCGKGFFQYFLKLSQTFANNAASSLQFSLQSCIEFQVRQV